MNPEWLQGIGSIVGAAGSVYGGYKQAQAAEGLLNLQNQQFDFNKNQILADEQERDAEKKRREQIWGGTDGVLDLSQGM